MYSILKRKQEVISSIHHQAIHKLGENLRAVAIAEDDTIEIIESVEADFIIGIQGHIEKMIHNFPEYHKIFLEFINSAHK